MKIGVIISTYNNVAWLEKTLWGYVAQTRRPDEVIIADDGSGPETRALIERFATLLPIRHVWHEDKGFRKTRILNRAVEEATADYLVFGDQDCLPRRDFLATHERYAAPGRFLSGGVFRLPMDISRAITPGDIREQRPFRFKWLKDRGMKWSVKALKLTPRRWVATLMNRITPAGATWNGGTSSTWRQVILDAGGFDERMGYGGEDREFGERLVNAGLKGRQIRYSACLLHLDHARPYKNEEAIAANDAIRAETRRTRRTRTDYGIPAPEKKH